MNKEEKSRSVHQALSSHGFTTLPRIPFDPGGDPVTILTNCCIYPFDEQRYVRSQTKAYYGPTAQAHLMNVTAAAAVQLMEQGLRVILHVPLEIEERMRELVALHPRVDLCTIVTGDLSKRELRPVLYAAILDMAKHRPVSRVDMCLYDSYASGLEKPFLPMFEDDPEVAGRIMAERTNFFFAMSMMAYDLLTRCGQSEMRIVCPTALAAKRPSAHLCTDTLHKAVSNVMLRTLGHELPYYTQKPVRIVEVAPGIIDTGLYDAEPIRQATYVESVIDGFAMQGGTDLALFPLLSIESLAAVCVAYLRANTDEQLVEYAGEDAVRLTQAGRSIDDLRSAFSRLVRSNDDGSVSLSGDLPEYCFAPGTVWGALSPLCHGYSFVPLTPPGQLF